MTHPRKPIKPTSFTRSKFLIISMASLLTLSLISLIAYLSLSSAAHQHHPPPRPSAVSIPPGIHEACKATRYPEVCESTLVQSKNLPPNPTPLQIIQSSMSVSSENLKTAQSMIQAILDSSSGSQNRTNAAKSCLEVLHNSEYRISLTADALTRGKNKDARAWMSAALCFQTDCWSGLKYANDTQQVNQTMAFLNTLVGYTSNALSMLVSYDLFGPDTGSWRPPQTERNGFWEKSAGGSQLGFKGGVPSGLKPDVTVCKDGSNGCYKTVQEGVNAAPDNLTGKKFVIYIKAGGLSASGLRAIRYAREVDGIGQVVALDNDKASVEACERNIKFNGSVTCSKVESHLVDARVYMLTHPKEFDVVDLDPYGSPSVFLDSAVQSVADGGILMCTATDMAVLCGGYGEVCYSKYGSYPLKAKYCHEMALRILLACIESHANRYQRYIVPVLSVQMDFYIRVFVRIYTSASSMKSTPLKLSYVYQCVCDSFHLQSLGRTSTKDKSQSIRYLPGFGPVVPQECSDCGKKFTMGGPIWSASIHDQEWVTSILADVKFMKDRYPAYDRISAILTTISEELPDVPLFLSLHNLCAVLKCISPSAIIFRSAVINAGYRISGTHVDPLGMKSDAPMNVIWDIMRCWVKNHPVKAQPPDKAGSVILSKEPVLQANFAQAVASLSKAQANKVVRFLPNPEKHWGPKLRAGRQITSKHVSILGSEVVNGSRSREEESNH